MNKKQEKGQLKTAKKKTAKAKATTNRKLVSKKTATKKRVVKKASAKGVPVKQVISPRERYEMIATMAYYRAEQRNFEPGYDIQDWLDCESTIDDMMKGH
ncbi:MAG: DUF2934 domain-containing protein [Candidatus Thiodiazotropha sp. (ex Epidulcina cf. delphinae)]|nr:DUF2934 domain-containing protein [Candidatus Thiodiazotropha sp. (ex Epidulcina cf. delphinae)]